MIRGFFFDLDGTLVDTHMANYEAYRRALEDYGVSISFEEFKKSIGHQAKTFLPWFAPGLADDDYEDMAQKKKEYYKEAVQQSVLNVSLVDFMKKIQPNNTIVLVTTAKKDNAMTVLKHHGLSEVFDFVITAEDVDKSKPHPECYEKALKKAKLKPEEVIAFEDSEPGIKAAESAGIAALLIKDFNV